MERSFREIARWTTGLGVEDCSGVYRTQLSIASRGGVSRAGASVGAYFEACRRPSFKGKLSEPRDLIKLEAVMKTHSPASPGDKKRALWQVQRTFLRLTWQKSCLVSQTGFEILPTPLLR